MSYFDNQMTSFRSNLASTSHKLSTKRTVAAAIHSTPSPAPAQVIAPAANRPDLKRKRPDTTTIYSQPADTGTGQALLSKSTFAVKYLRDKKTPITWEQLSDYLSLHQENHEYGNLFRMIIRENPKVLYDPSGFHGKGSYSFRPKHAIRNGEDLLRQLQAQSTAKGLPVKELLEGWETAEDDIRELEKDNKLLVIRNKKDDHARTVWQNDPTLAQNIDFEFRDIWTKIKLPDPETTMKDLEKQGLLPTNKLKKEAVKNKAPEKKTKKPRRTGKTTNTHMLGVLRDFSHLKR